MRGSKSLPPRDTTSFSGQWLLGESGVLGFSSLVCLAGLGVVTPCEHRPWGGGVSRIEGISPLRGLAFLWTVPLLPDSSCSVWGAGHRDGRWSAVVLPLVQRQSHLQRLRLPCDEPSQDDGQKLGAHLLLGPHFPKAHVTCALLWQMGTPKLGQEAGTRHNPVSGL